MGGIDVFNKYFDEYEQWFVENKAVYETEIEAVKKLLPKDQNGLEIGVGSGRFAVPLGIKTGVEPSDKMADISRKQGINVVKGFAEELPFDDETFDYALIVVTICFVDDPIRTIKEAKRIIKKGGYLIIAIVDRDSFLGQIYESIKDENKFYRYATFFSTDDIIAMMKREGFNNIQTIQTLFKPLDKIKEKDEIREGYGEGGFVVIKAQK